MIELNVQYWSVIIPPVFCLQCVGARVLLGGVVDDDGGDGASLVLVCPHGVLLVVARELPVDRMPPGEDWRRFSSTLDLPEGGPVGTNCLRPGLTLVNARSN